MEKKATALNNLGSSCINLGKYEKAVMYYQRCQNIQNKTLAENHPDYTRTLNNLGSSYVNLGKY